MSVGRGGELHHIDIEPPSGTAPVTGKGYKRSVAADIGLRLSFIAERDAAMVCEPTNAIRSIGRQLKNFVIEGREHRPAVQ